MRKIFTLVYLVNNPECDQNLLLRDYEFTDEGFGEFSDVFEVLNKTHYEPGNSVVQLIVEFAKTYYK